MTLNGQSARKMTLKILCSLSRWSLSSFSHGAMMQETKGASHNCEDKIGPILLCI